MSLQIHCTPDGLKAYPLHKHDSYEIMLYIEGKGVLRTPETDFPFSTGKTIIVPPGTEHGSVSENGFKNISVSGDFNNLFHQKQIISLDDTPEKEGTALAKMLFRNRHKDSRFVSTLCTAYIHFILQNMRIESSAGSAVNRIVEKISTDFHDFDIDVCEILKESGYAEDYIRSEFKRVTGKTPVAFLTETRINHAALLIDIYADTLSLQEIAGHCGYTDYVYFSKKFKALKGLSPKEYKNKLKG